VSWENNRFNINQKSRTIFFPIDQEFLQCSFLIYKSEKNTIQFFEDHLIWKPLILWVTSLTKIHIRSFFSLSNLPSSFKLYHINIVSWSKKLYPIFVFFCSVRWKYIRSLLSHIANDVSR
jgi:hypothetical protein